VSGREIAQVQRDPSEAVGRHGVSGVEEPVDHTTLVKDLQRAGQQTASPRAVDVLIGSSFDDDGVDTGDCQLGCQHQPGRSCTDDHDAELVPDTGRHPRRQCARNHGSPPLSRMI
jgi:hypothetical protein